jgi:hypothetical protein
LLPQIFLGEAIANSLLAGAPPMFVIVIWFKKNRDRDRDRDQKY